jgi:hypothetical protein
MANTPPAPPAKPAKPAAGTGTPAPAAATPAAPKPVVGSSVAAAGGPVKPQATAQAIRPAAFKIREVQRRERYLKLLVYGNYGTGKTYLAGTASEVASMGDILMINAESGDLTLDAFTGIDEITVREFRTLARVYEFIVQHCKYRDAGADEQLWALQNSLFDGMSDRLRRYRTVIVDSLSEIEKLALNQVLGITDSTKLDDNPDAAEWKEYKQNHTLVIRMVRAFRNLPMHIIFTCAESFVQDETKKMKYQPALTGKLAKEVQGFMDMVGYLVAAQKAAPMSPQQVAQAAADPNDTGPQSRRLYVTPSAQGKFDAKHRYVNFKGTHFDDPSILKILQQTKLIDAEGAFIRE